MEPSRTKGMHGAGWQTSWTRTQSRPGRLVSTVRVSTIPRAVHPKQGPEAWAAADKRFASGFGVIDWQRGASQPELVLWPAEDDDLAIYSQLMRVSLDLFGLLLASLVRFSVKGADPLPLVQRDNREFSAAEEEALSQLARSDYLAMALARRTTPAA